MEYSATPRSAPAGLRGPSTLLRLQSDERLVALTRRGNDAAYEALVGRYQSRLLAFCRHMLSSREDAEDVLQEVFASAYSAMLADQRAINVRPWLYRIARNRSLNHLRKQTAIGVDSMDVHLADHGTSTADRVDEREELRALLGDVQELAETQRTALLLREVDALSYEQIAEAMDTTVPAVKSLLVRARVGLAEAAEARRLTCDEVREELGAWAEGLAKVSPPVRRHVKDCERCAGFKQQLKANNRALAALFPLGPILILQKLILSHGASQAASGGAAAAAVGSASSGAAVSAGVSTIASKAAAGLAAVAIVTTGAVEVERVQERSDGAQAKPVAVAAPASAPGPTTTATPVVPPVVQRHHDVHEPSVVATRPQPARPTREAARRETTPATTTATTTTTTTTTATTTTTTAAATTTTTLATTAATTPVAPPATTVAVTPTGTTTATTTPPPAATTTPVTPTTDEEPVVVGGSPEAQVDVATSRLPSAEQPRTSTGGSARR